MFATSQAHPRLFPYSDINPGHPGVFYKIAAFISILPPFKTFSNQGSYVIINKGILNWGFLVMRQWLPSPE